MHTEALNAFTDVQLVTAAGGRRQNPYQVREDGDEIQIIDTRTRKYVDYCDRCDARAHTMGDVARQLWLAELRAAEDAAYSAALAHLTADDAAQVVPPEDEDAGAPALSESDVDGETRAQCSVCRGVYWRNQATGRCYDIADREIFRCTFCGCDLTPHLAGPDDEPTPAQQAQRDDENAADMAAFLRSTGEAGDGQTDRLAAAALALYGAMQTWEGALPFDPTPFAAYSAAVRAFKAAVAAELGEVMA